MDKLNLQKLEELNNRHVVKVVEEAVRLCKPAKVVVITDSKEDVNYVRELALAVGEEKELKMEGHTIHFDGYYDQGRDKDNTKYLLSKDVDWGIKINSMKKDKGLKEIYSFLDGSMTGKEMLVRFFSLGPTNSVFSLKALQITDSAYVAHSEDLLYRQGYEEFKKLNGSPDFFFFLHSAGRLENGVSVDIDKRRIYIDLEENRVYSVNNQYAGNSLGLKKLAFRLAINKAQNEEWLAEHMFVMGVHGPKDRVTYFTGAFPSGCGKTSTAMIPGQSVVGDDIAYLKKINGVVRAVNVENGIFGIIRDVNPQDDPLIYQALTTPREMIFSNVLINDGIPYWLGMGKDIPDKGINHSGEWFKGKKDSKGNVIDCSHKNARYTIRLNALENVDPKANDPAGVPVQAIIYGGRDSDTTMPIVESLSWSHGVFFGATVESETTSATIGAQGIRKHNPMANLDFISVPFNTYIENHLKFSYGLKEVPKIYTTNYFLKDESGNYLNSKLDKKVWLLWAEGRVYGEYEAIETPVGLIPKYEDLKTLFIRELDKDYTKAEYIQQFSLRVVKYLEKMERMSKIFRNIQMPSAFTEELKTQTERLKLAKTKYGEDIISPFKFLDI
ncbi:MAG TPA: phosphoenolpyruvate carboxykinase (GTP) [Candidatus Atribacteria bacterium]|jgi:phosphoenolpyruvate carboxykinase (GTP)|nr:phosphoenolpyruvate carboxykinase (GTP) [Candidatus Atribacteria bacterium]